MERTAEHFQCWASDIGDSETAFPFTKAPWEQPPEVVISPADQVANITSQLHRSTLYTDASVRHGQVGLAVVYLPETGPPRGDVRTVDRGPRPDVRTAEIEAIGMALELSAQFTNALAHSGIIAVATDSQRALRAIARPSKLPSLRIIYRALRKIRSNGATACLHWVPAHSGIRGNELAHEASRTVSDIGRIPTDRRWKPALKPEINHHRAALLSQGTAKRLIELDQALPGSHVRRLYDQLKRREAAILAQLRTGYCRLNSYLHKISQSETEQCDCGQPETVEHFLIHCPRWNQQRLATWNGNQPGLHDLCGAWNGQRSREGWKPDRKGVQLTISFAASTKRLEWDYGKEANQ